VEKFAWINLLYDFYGHLLTERQRRFVELHYGHDLSLGEIAEKCRVSRQAVHDVLKRAEKTLSGCEEKLGLAGRFLQQRSRLKEALALLDGEEGEKISRLREIIKEAMAL
jgi:predicted DNA-binding protein YlxM (UPF0122 family)